MMSKKPYSDPRWYDDPGGISSQCNTCAHYHGFGKCDAFPERIPRKILDNDVKHDVPIEGDQGIQFAPMPESK